MAMPTYMSSPEQLMFQTFKTSNKFGTADPMQVQYQLENDQREDEQRHQAFMARYTRDLDDAQQIRRMSQGIYDNTEQMLMDPYGPAHKWQDSGRSMDFSIDGGPTQALPLRARAARPEFAGAIEAMRPRNFQEVKGAPGSSRYGEDAKTIEVLQQAIGAMRDDDPDLPGFQALLKDKMRGMLQSSAPTISPREVGGAAVDTMRSIPGLGGLASLGEQFLKPRDPIMYSEGNAPLAPASASTPKAPSVQVAAPAVQDPKMAALIKRYKEKYPNKTDEQIMAAIQRSGVGG